MNEKEEIYWIWLSTIKELENKKIKLLLNKMENIEKIYNATKAELLQIKGIDEKLADKITDKENKNKIKKYQEYMHKNQIGILSYKSDKYPEKLKHIYDKPFYLYYRGNIEILNQNGIAIIGCRQATNYGIKISKEMAYKLTKENINIISGLARGIDTSAHIGALQADGKTIAVLGNGINSIYPKENEKLAYQIIQKGGCIISEYTIGIPPEKYHFPARNRIISGLSDGVLVVEAKQKSGTMITVEFALEQGKDIFAIPGSIEWENSKGTNQLISEGAIIITSAKELIDYQK